MRCIACNRNLTDFESTRKSAETNEYLDMCTKCTKGLDINTIDREDLRDVLPDDWEVEGEDHDDMDSDESEESDE